MSDARMTPAMFAEKWRWFLKDDAYHSRFLTDLALTLRALEAENARLLEGANDMASCSPASVEGGWRCETHKAPMIPTPTCHVGARHFREGLERERDALAERVRALEGTLRDVLWWSLTIVGHGSEDHRCRVCDCRARDITQMVHKSDCIMLAVKATLAPASAPTADTLAAGLPEGMLPKDIELLRDANAALAERVRGLEGLRWLVYVIGASTPTPVAAFQYADSGARWAKSEYSGRFRMVDTLVAGKL